MNKLPVDKGTEGIISATLAGLLGWFCYTLYKIHRAQEKSEKDYQDFKNKILPYVSEVLDKKYEEYNKAMDQLARGKYNNHINNLANKIYACKNANIFVDSKSLNIVKDVNKFDKELITKHILASIISKTKEHDNLALAIVTDFIKAEPSTIATIHYTNETFESTMGDIEYNSKWKEFIKSIEKIEEYNAKEFIFRVSPIDDMIEIDAIPVLLSKEELKSLIKVIRDGLNSSATESLINKIDPGLEFFGFGAPKDQENKYDSVFGDMTYYKSGNYWWAPKFWHPGDNFYKLDGKVAWSGTFIYHPVNSSKQEVASKFKYIFSQRSNFEKMLTLLGEAINHNEEMSGVFNASCNVQDIVAGKDNRFVCLWLDIDYDTYLKEDVAALAVAFNKRIFYFFLTQSWEIIILGIYPLLLGCPFY